MFGSLRRLTIARRAVTRTEPVPAPLPRCRVAFRSINTGTRAPRATITATAASGGVVWGRRMLFGAVSAAAFGASACYYLASAEAPASDATADGDADSLLHRHRKAHDELLAAFGDRYSILRDERESHGTPTNSYHFSGSLPSAVVYPSSTADVQAIARICSRYRIPMIPFGSGTSLEGHTVATRAGGVCIDLSRMDRIIRVSAADMDVSVEPGISWGNLNSELSALGLFFPVDPGPGASIGGMVATSCSGTNAVRYGTMKHNVLNVTVVLADGTVLKTAQRARKSSAGYDLTRLFIGSEGTLGIVTEVTLRLSQIPKHTSVGVCAFDTIAHATNAVIEMMQSGVRIGCVELMDEVMIKAVNGYAGFNYALKPTLFFKFSGPSAAAVNDDIAAVASIVQKHTTPESPTPTPTPTPTPASPPAPKPKNTATTATATASAVVPATPPARFLWATSAAERDRLWEARKGALWAAMTLRPEAKVWTTDVCVPIARLAECIELTKRDLESSFLPAPIVGHVGDGNFHVCILLDPNDPKEVAEAQRINKRMIDRAIKMEGTCTGEHGVGLGKREYLVAELGVETVNLMKRIKLALDPNNLLNPGKVIDVSAGAAAAATATAVATPHSHMTSNLDCDHTPLPASPPKSKTKL